MIALALLACLVPSDWVVYEGGKGPGKGKHIVLITGDEEYRSEEGLPQLARILAKRHGFKCTVLFSIGKDGTIDPNCHDNEPGLEALDSADLCIMLLRFRCWPDTQMAHFVNYYLSGKPIIALRTSTHAFEYAAGSTSTYRNFDWRSPNWRQVVGETWVSHWGDHGHQATRGVIAADLTSHPIVRGVPALFGTTDVYEAHPPQDAEILVQGQVLAGMRPTDPPATGRKRTSLGIEQEINEPMMPLVWVRHPRNKAGKVNTVVTCTMGAATDLLDERLRRLLVNAAYWTVGLEKKVPARADVNLVGEYRPSAFGFDGFRKGVAPSSLRDKRP